MRKLRVWIAVIAACVALAACGRSQTQSAAEGVTEESGESTDSELLTEDSESTGSEPVAENNESADSAAQTENSDPADSEPSADDSKEESEETDMITITVGDTVLTAKLENNESAKAFRDLMPITVQMSGYGGFEQVGSLGTRLPRKDRQTTTSAGDIMLYNGNSVVMFYGSNSWSYTRLGKIEGKSASELRDILGDGDIEVTFAVEK